MKVDAELDGAAQHAIASSWSAAAPTPGPGSCIAP